jgi:4-oxalocrotonate tautomerase
MPLVRAELPVGKPAEYRAAVGQAIQQAMHAALKVPLEERFHIFTEHAPADLVIGQTYLGIERSADAIVVQVTLNEGRDAEVKRGFYRTPQNTTRQAFGHRTATFAEDTLVNDQLRDYWGKPTIREWAKRDIIGERLTMNVTKMIKHYGNFIVTANVDGNYDKRGLPDPLVLAFYFTAQSDLIVQLIILRNRFDI